MNRNKLKTYAPEARRDFIEAVTARAAQYGLTAKNIEPMTVEGDVAMIAGKPYSKEVGEKRKKLEARINRDGFEQTMEAMAYTWFNRLVAIRFMELHEYLDHGYRVLSHPQGHSLPEIVEHAEHVDLPGLDKKRVIELKLDGTKEEELYRLLLIGQCNALSKAMPFLFESIDDETELLLPDHLLHSDSLIRNLVNEIPEEDWQEVEIIGWLYQFYISEKKDEVIGKVVKSEDIPAATQLFTPNWIVKYLVQNSLGRQWMATYPDSPLKEQMEYYIEPAEQTPEVEAKLAEITPDSLNPEELTLLDPACGSGHILVEAYDLLKAIYQERGYRAKDIPRLILEKNLYGLEIDDRAAQLAAFALMMKARADDRNIFERDMQPHVLSIQDSQGLDAKDITEALNAPLPDGSTGDISQADVAHLIELFEDGKTFGSLIQVPKSLELNLGLLDRRGKKVMSTGGMIERAAVATLSPIIAQAGFLARAYQCVVTNPPFLGRKAMNAKLKQYARTQFPGADSDVFAMFTIRATRNLKTHGDMGFVTPFVWLFIASHETLRRHLTTNMSISTLVKPSYTSFFSSAVVPLVAYTATDSIHNLRGSYFDLGYLGSAESQPVKLKEAIVNPHSEMRFLVTSDEIHMIAGMPIAYWVSDRLRQIFATSNVIGDFYDVKEGLGTRDDDIFLRRFWEIPISKMRRSSGGTEKWTKTDKAGGVRKWYGNCNFLMNWEDDGFAIKNHRNPDGTLKSRPQNTQYFFRPAVSWGKVGSGASTFRLRDDSWAFNDAAPSLFGPKLLYLLGLLNSCVLSALLKVHGTTLNVTTGVVAKLPYVECESHDFISRSAQECVDISTRDWDSAEISWDFRRFPLLSEQVSDVTIRAAFEGWSDLCKADRKRIRQLEEGINRELIKAYELSGELSPEVPEDQIALHRPDREEDIQRLLSYSIGCMMGRYSLDAPGLIYAHSGNEGFEPSEYKSFPADEDGIIPLAEFHWFENDAASRFEKFVATAWPKEHLEENLEFVAESLGRKRGESTRDTIRRYLAADFFKHHLSLYKKRPIYWLFSSGKQRGFQALVYLHRYNEGTLARMRTEYVIPLLGKMTARIDHLTDDIAAASSSQHQKRLEKEKATVVKQLAEVQQFDEKLRHYADQRISLDLDDGVKVNYGKFGTLLAEVKAVTGKKPKEVVIT